MQDIKTDYICGKKCLKVRGVSVQPLNVLLSHIIKMQTWVSLGIFDSFYPKRDLG